MKRNLGVLSVLYVLWFVVMVPFAADIWRSYGTDFFLEVVLMVVLLGGFGVLIFSLRGEDEHFFEELEKVFYIVSLIILIICGILLSGAVVL